MPLNKAIEIEVKHENFFIPTGYKLMKGNYLLPENPTQKDLEFYERFLLRRKIYNID